jgi:hypothetical protein
MARATGPSDEELVEEFQRGDPYAFDVLVGRWDRKIQGAIYRIMGPEEDAGTSARRRCSRRIGRWARSRRRPVSHRGCIRSP